MFDLHCQRKQLQTRLAASRDYRELAYSGGSTCSM